MMSTKQFKVLMQGLSREQKAECPPSIPWAMIEPHEAQAKRNHSQTLQRLNERGGCAPNEIYAIMHDRDWSSQIPVDPIEWLKSAIADYEALDIIADVPCSCPMSSELGRHALGYHHRMDCPKYQSMDV